MTNNQIWFITGASELFGLELTKSLLEHGYRVAATSLYKGILEKEIDRYPENFLPLSADPTDEASLGSAIAQTMERFGRIDTFVNNAGHYPFREITEFSDEELHHNFEETVFGSWYVLQKAVPLLQDQQPVHIISFASPAVSRIAGDCRLHRAAKLAVEHLSANLLSELPQGVHLTTIAPSTLRTTQGPETPDLLRELSGGERSGAPSERSGKPGERNRTSGELSGMQAEASKPADPAGTDDLSRAVAAVIRTAEDWFTTRNTASY